MKFDQFGCVIREKYEPEFHPGNIGDSCYYTGHYVVLSHDKDVSFMPFQAEIKGYYRHPELPKQTDVSWGGTDHFSNDQFVPMVCGTLVQGRPLTNLRLQGNEWQIPGTFTILNPAAWALIRKQYWLLNLFNYAQGLILKFPYRYNDQKKRLERTSESSVDYLNMVMVWVFLKRMGKTAWLGASKEKCKQMIDVYYRSGTDSEPNVDWLVNLYYKWLK
jgi:hypothetical protein